MTYRTNAKPRRVRRVEPGSVFGKRTVIETGPRASNRSKVWMCRCACGDVSAVRQDTLLRGAAHSCRSCATKQHGEAKRDGYSGTSEYGSWSSMRQRCLDSSANNYGRYGGRGIGICDRWKSFQKFLLDMGRKPSEAHSLDRIDNDGDYEPANCRWATKKEQSRNRSNNRTLVLDGVKKTVAEWSEQTGVSRSTICSRLDRGRTERDALARPVIKDTRP